MIKAIDVRRGMAVTFKDQIWTVHDIQKVAKGNWRSFMQIKFKNLFTGQIVEERFRVDEELDQPFLDKKPMEYLYSAGADEHILMDTASFEQVHVNSDVITAEQIGYLKPNEQVLAMLSSGQVIMVELPNVVELRVTEAPPAVKGSTATNQYKEATLETGLRVMVPPFVEIGDAVPRERDHQLAGGWRGGAFFP